MKKEDFEKLKADWNPDTDKLVVSEFEPGDYRESNHGSPNLITENDLKSCYYAIMRKSETLIRYGSNAITEGKPDLSKCEFMDLVKAAHKKASSGNDFFVSAWEVDGKQGVANVGHPLKIVGALELLSMKVRSDVSAKAVDDTNG